MPDLPVVVTEELKRKVRSAGANKLDQMQLAISLGVSDHECRMLMLKHPELAAEYRSGETKESLNYLSTLKTIANDPEHKQQFIAAKYLYELFSGRNSGPNTVVVNQHFNENKNHKLIEILDADTVEQISND